MCNYEVHYQYQGVKFWDVVEAANCEDARGVLRNKFPGDVVFVLAVYPAQDGGFVEDDWSDVE